MPGIRRSARKRELTARRLLPASRHTPPLHRLAKGLWELPNLPGELFEIISRLSTIFSPERRQKFRPFSRRHNKPSQSTGEDRFSLLL
jgi:hypothetical protein